MAKTRQEAAAEALREAIVDGVYAPGRRLRQQELAKEFGCSAIPIREALQRLAAEGFVVLDPQRGARVAAFDGRMLEEIFEVRIALEQIAVRRAATRMTPAVAERTRRILERMERPALPPAEWVHLDWEFHDSLCEAAEQEFLRKMISNLRRQMEPYLRLDLTKVGTITLGRLEHRRIFQACRRRDGDAAARHMIAHLQRTVRGFVEYIRRHAREPEAVSGPPDAAASKNSRPRAQAPEAWAVQVIGGARTREGRLPVLSSRSRS